MAFTNNFRIERVYFERLKTLIEVLKSYKDNVAEEPARTIIENSIDVDGAVLLLYRNLGEAWAELADLIQKTQKLLQDLDDKTEAYHDELNERIDEVNNYLMALIRALEARVDAIEADLQQMGRLFTYDLNRENDEYSLSESGNPVTFESTAELFSHTRPHLVTVRGNVNGETTYFFPREYDSDTTDGLFEWYSFGFVGNEIHEITVTLLPDDSVNVAVETTDFTTILSRLLNLEQNKQDKLTPGQNITIDANNVISATGGGENIITVTQSGSSYTADKTYAEIKEMVDNNNAVSVRLVRTNYSDEYLNLWNHSATATPVEFIFMNEYLSTNNTYQDQIRIGNDNSVYFTKRQISFVTVDNLSYYFKNGSFNYWSSENNQMVLNNTKSEIPLFSDAYASNPTFDTIDLNALLTYQVESIAKTLNGYQNLGTNYFLMKKLGSYPVVDIFDRNPVTLRVKNGITDGGIGSYSASKKIIPHIKMTYGFYLSYFDGTQTIQRFINGGDNEMFFLVNTDGAIELLATNNGRANEDTFIQSDFNIQGLCDVIKKWANEYGYSPKIHCALQYCVWFEDETGARLDTTQDTDLNTNINKILDKLDGGFYYLYYQTT